MTTLSQFASADPLGSFLLACFVGGSTLLAYANLSSTSSGTVGTKSKQLARPSAKEEEKQVSAVLDKLARSGPLPAMVVCDLDFSLWPLFMDTHVSRPIRRPTPDAINHVVDPFGYPIRFFPHVPAILLWLKQHGVKLAAASRTLAPPSAYMALEEMRLRDTRPGHEDQLVSALSLFDYIEIYPGSKLRHFGQLQRKSGIAFSDMLFFDDEERNGEVAQLGPTFVHVPNGVDVNAVQQGVLAWRGVGAASQASASRSSKK